MSPCIAPAEPSCLLEAPGSPGLPRAPSILHRLPVPPLVSLCPAFPEPSASCELGRARPGLPGPVSSVRPAPSVPASLSPLSFPLPLCPGCPSSPPHIPLCLPFLSPSSLRFSLVFSPPFFFLWVTRIPSPGRKAQPWPGDPLDTGSVHTERTCNPFRGFAVTPEEPQGLGGPGPGPACRGWPCGLVLGDDGASGQGGHGLPGGPGSLWGLGPRCPGPQLWRLGRPSLRREGVLWTLEVTELAWWLWRDAGTAVCAQPS